MIKIIERGRHIEITDGNVTVHGYCGTNNLQQIQIADKMNADEAMAYSKLFRRLAKWYKDVYLPMIKEVELSDE